MNKTKGNNWKNDYDAIAADKVQVWSPDGTMLTDQMSKAEACLLVKYGFCYVVNPQAIRQYEHQGV